MSKQRSQSPHHRFPLKEPDLGYYKGLKQDKDHFNRREDHPERRDFLREDMYPEDRRRPTGFSDGRRPFMHYNHSNQDKFYHRRPPPRYDSVGYGDHQTLSPPHRAEDRDDHRRGFREHSKGFNSWARSPKSPLRVQREELPSTPRFHSDHQHRDSKRREEQGGGWEKFRERSPNASSHPHKWEAGWERGRRNSCERERPREESHRERTPPFRRQRRKLEDADDHHGYRNKEFEEQHYATRNKFGRDAEGSSGPLIIEHDHGFKRPSQERFERRDRASEDVQPRSSLPAKRCRMSGDGADSREDGSGRQDDGRGYPEARRNPAHQGGATYKPRGKGGFHGRAGAHRSRPHGQEASRGFPDVPQERAEWRSFVGDDYKDGVGTEDARSEPWTSHRSRSRERPPHDADLDPKRPRQWTSDWERPKSQNMTTVTEETLTIKVDMTRPASKNSVRCSSSDRQLSLDLVNVGRQRLDFLPMLEHSGTYRESPTRTGTFAQEIIALVHQVKEQYFGGGGATLNERFSAPRKGGAPEDKEAEKLTLNQRFSSNQGFRVKVSSQLDEEETAFSSPLQPVRGPGDLRHDLERRRQERTEGVRVTIAGSTPQRPPVASKTSEGYGGEGGGFPHPSGRREDFSMEARRGGPPQAFKAFQRRNYGNQTFRPMRRQRKNTFQAGPGS